MQNLPIDGHMISLFLHELHTLINPVLPPTKFLGKNFDLESTKLLFHAYTYRITGLSIQILPWGGSVPPMGVT